MKVNNFNELYLAELRDLYSAEIQLTRALPKIADAASTPDLKQALTTHLQQTRGQVERLVQIFGELEESAEGHMCRAMEGLLKEGDEFIGEVEAGPVRDAAIIASCQKVEHYEIAGYGTAKTFANLLGFVHHIDLLEDTENEEAQADQLLTHIAMSMVNDRAAAAGSRR